MPSEEEEQDEEREEGEEGALDNGIRRANDPHPLSNAIDVVERTDRTGNKIR